MNHEYTLPETSSDIPPNVALNAKNQDKKWHYPGCQARQKVGFSGRRSCDLYLFALCWWWANTVKWLK